MSFSRRQFHRFVAGAGALAACGQLGRSAASASETPGFRAMVGVFLLGGNDGWNTLVPTDARHAAYASARGTGLALARASLVPLAGVPYGLHPALAPLKTAWDDGAMTALTNVGTLFQPLTRALYAARPDLRPINLMSHPDEQGHWQGCRARGVNRDGFMGRINDRVAGSQAIPELISIAGSNLALIGRSSAPLVLSSVDTFRLSGATAGNDGESRARQAAIDAFADGTGLGSVTDLTARSIAAAYRQGAVVDAVLARGSGLVDRFFVDATGRPLTSEIALQLRRVAHMIEARALLGHSRQVFFTAQGNYDTHAAQVLPGDPTAGDHARLLTDLGRGLAAFYAATKALGVADQVTTFTMSDFGRVYKGNAQLGSDHAWGSNHLVLGGAVRGQTIHGRYPVPILGGPDDCDIDGRWIPTISQEEYIGPIARWFGVADADLPYVFPNWESWRRRAPLPLFA